MGLLNDVDVLRSASRAQTLLAIREEQRARRAAPDVTGEWLGFKANGMGLVRYDGQIYECEVLSRTGRQKHAAVNLRRTPSGNFVDWQ
jgi:hypothetical protein